MSFTLNYNIREEDVRKLELISKTDGYLQVLRMNPDWASILERNADLEEAVSSIGVEGTVLTMDQAKAITVGKAGVKVGEKERREFVGYLDALRFVKGLVDRDLTQALLLRIHEMITRGDAAADPGRFRQDQRGVQSNEKIIYTAPPHQQLVFLLPEFVRWFNRAAADKTLSPVIAAAICHFWLVWIHPFCDGNGRTARLLTTYLLLKKKSEGIRYFALSDYYNKNKSAYYDALETTNRCDPATPAMNFSRPLDPWMAFFINSYLDQMESIKEVTNRILQLNIRVEHLRREKLITAGHEKVLSFLYSRERASYKELRAELNVTTARVHQVLAPLRKAHILVEETIGKEKWFKLGSPDQEPDETVLKKSLKGKTVHNTRPSAAGSRKQAVLPIFG